MANTYTQLIVQIIFAVQCRENLINESFRNRLEKYLCGIVINNKSKPLAIFCNPDHTHILIGIHPAISVSTLAGDIKACSAKWINLLHIFPGRFNWQDGYGAFSYSKSQINEVANYIINQPLHHKVTTFKEEYLSILKKAEIDYDLAYLFNWLD